jgi:hypothetical protein
MAGGTKMTFVEELKQLSEKVELQHKLDRQLAEVKAKMKVSAKNGYRCFKVEIFTISMSADPVCLPEVRAENYYAFYTGNEDIYVETIIKFLGELGFTMSDMSFIKSIRENAGYKSMLITITW